MNGTTKRINLRSLIVVSIANLLSINISLTSVLPPEVGSSRPDFYLEEQRHGSEASIQLASGRACEFVVGYTVSGLSMESPMSTTEAKD